MTLRGFGANQVVQILTVTDAHQRRRVTEILAQAPRPSVCLSCLRRRITLGDHQGSTEFGLQIELTSFAFQVLRQLRYEH